MYPRITRLWRESAKVVSRAKRGISTYQALSAEILPRFARQDTTLALSRQRPTRLCRESTKVVSRAKQGISTYNFLSRYENPHASLGLSLLEVLVALAIIGILAVVSSLVFSRISRNFSDTKKKMDIEELRSFLLREIDCSATAAQLTICDGSTKVNVYGRGSRVLIRANSETKVGNLALTATCSEWLKVTATQGAHTQDLFESGLCKDQITKTTPLIVQRTSKFETSYIGCSSVSATDVNHTMRIFEQTVNCPSGYAPISGGGVCGFLPSGGLTLVSKPVDNGWMVRCCVVWNLAGNTTINSASVTCMRQDRTGRLNEN